VDEREIISVNGKDYPMPTNLEKLGDEDLYMVPFSMIVVAEEQEESDGQYHWHNPRYLGQTGNAAAPGFGKQDIQELNADIVDEGLINPLVCRWVVTDGVISVQVLDGERRYRCIDKQRTKNEKVYSRKEKQWLPAQQVHEKIPCRIIQGNDKEALKIAFMVSDRSIRWGDSATVKLIRKLRKCGTTDQEILQLTKKSLQWLREQDRLCDLDEVTFSYFESGKINRALALMLCDIDDVDRRHRYLHAAYDDALANHEETLEKAEKDLEKAETKEELAEAELAEAKEKGDEEAVESTTTKLKTAKLRTETKRRQKADASKPKAKTKNLRNAATKLAEEEGEVPSDIAQILRPGKIREHYEMLNKLIANEGKDEEGEEVMPLESLQIVAACYKAIVCGESDIMKVLSKIKDGPSSNDEPTDDNTEETTEDEE
jgi:6-pyruvoyl-tetrahydropterin synthase